MKRSKAILLIIASLFYLGCEDEKPFDGCIDPDKVTNNPCPEIYTPVCGCDQKTYSNSCFAESAGLVSWTEGKCN